jgi:hypothetical protein
MHRLAITPRPLTTHESAQNHEGMRPLAQAKGTPHQCIYEQPLMAFIMAIDMVLALICFGDALFREASGSQVNQRCGDLSPASLSQGQHSAPSPPPQKQFDRHQWH